LGADADFALAVFDFGAIFFARAGFFADALDGLDATFDEIFFAAIKLPPDCA
jgi:hypothetical protein